MRSLARYRVEHEKMKFISTSGHIIFCLLYNHQWKRRDLFCNHNDGDLFTCEDNMLFSRVKIWSFRAKAHLVFHWCFQWIAFSVSWTTGTYSAGIILCVRQMSIIDTVKNICICTSTSPLIKWDGYEKYKSLIYWYYASRITTYNCVTPPS